MSQISCRTDRSRFCVNLNIVIKVICKYHIIIEPYLNHGPAFLFNFYVEYRVAAHGPSQYFNVLASLSGKGFLQDNRNPQFKSLKVTAVGGKDHQAVRHVVFTLLMRSPVHLFHLKMLIKSRS